MVMSSPRPSVAEDRIGVCPPVTSVLTKMRRPCGSLDTEGNLSQFKSNTFCFEINSSVERLTFLF